MARRPLRRHGRFKCPSRRANSLVRIAQSFGLIGPTKNRASHRELTTKVSQSRVSNARWQTPPLASPRTTTVVLAFGCRTIKSPASPVLLLDKCRGNSFARRNSSTKKRQHRSARMLPFRRIGRWANRSVCPSAFLFADEGWGYSPMKESRL